ncbi:nudt9 protein [Gigaspora margarita]|uniref:Nudt9 protein n=1 Tax=Gigaspora margarita TaxID=4874 RepID=A0A8H3X4D8_GIGMA|nr:nudt9 protein [Gigaspora margarita]
MEITLEQHIQIMNESEKDFNPHNDRPVKMIESSPNMDYIATWSEKDLLVVGWSIVKNEYQLKHEYMISQKDVDYEKCFKLYINDLLTIKSFAVSNNKQVSMPIYGESDGLIKKIGVFDFSTKQQYRLGFPYSSYLLIYLNFLENNDLITIVDNMIDTFNGYKIYVFTQKKNEMIHKSTIKLDIKPHQIFMSPKGKLFIYDEDIRKITKWDIKTLKFEMHFLVKPFSDIDIKISDNKLFLLVHVVKYVAKRLVNSSIFIYLAKNGMKLTSYVWDGLEIYAFDLIASKSCARLLIRAQNKKNDQNIYHIMDPFASSKKVDAIELLSYSETSDVQNQVQYPCIIKFDKVIGFIGKNLGIKKLISDDRNWISYLRRTLKDSNRIHASSFKKDIAELIDEPKNNISELKPINETFEKYFVKWTLRCDENFDILKAESLLEENASDEINFRPNYHNSPMPFTIKAHCLDNNNLVIIGQLSLLIWTFKAILEQKIRLKHLTHYGSYSKLSKSTYIDSLIDKIYGSILRCKFLNNKYINLSNTIRWYNRYSYDKLIVYKSPILPLLFPLPKFTWNSEAIINYKWNIFGKKYYFAAWTIYVVFLCSFVTVAMLSDIISWFYQIILINITIILGFWHLLIEMHQFIYSPKDYFSSSWNYLDKVISFLIIFEFISFTFAHSLYFLLCSISETDQDSDPNMFTEIGSAIIASYFMIITGDLTPISIWISN